MQSCRVLSSLLLVLLLQACSSTARLAGSGDCSRLLAGFEGQARQQNAWLSEPRPVASFPAFASNRFLASFDPGELDSDQRDAWLARLLDAGHQRRALLAAMMQAPQASSSGDEELLALERCARQALRTLPDDETTWAKLSAVLQVPDDYSLWRRAIGLYPLSSLAARGAIADLQIELRASYATPADNLRREGTLRYYLPPAYRSVAARNETVASPLKRDALGVVLPDALALEALLDRHAPVWAVDTVGDFDRPGVPFYAAGGIPRVDSSQAVVFTYASMTRFEGAPRLQLNYLLWFDGRPKENIFDSLGGHLDGLLWRVTLDEQGEVLLYDSVHACGCYQLYFPGSELALREAAMTLPEPPLVMREAPSLSRGERVTLHVSSTAHYLQGLSVSTRSEQAFLAQSEQRYTRRDYAGLYRVKVGDGTRSLFDRHGIVRGSERSERYYLWPMGIRSPGAMRERGRQATAFVGRRHFDDADLIDQLFRRSD